MVTDGEQKKTRRTLDRLRKGMKRKERNKAKSEHISVNAVKLFDKINFMSKSGHKHYQGHTNIVIGLYEVLIPRQCITCSRRTSVWRRVVPAGSRALYCCKPDLRRDVF